jgi:small multidrug resistance pump
MQTLISALLILITAVLNTVAQVALKSGVDISPFHWRVVVGLAVYGISAVLYIVLLGRLNLSVVYPITIGLTTISAMVSSLVIFHEKVSFTAWVGTGLILAGISAISLGRAQ